MMRKFICIALFVPLLFTGGTWTTSSNPGKAYEICQKTFLTTKTIKTLRYEMRKEERINGKMQVQVSFVKLNRNPYQVYMRQLSPKKGLEVLYNTEENDGKALVSPNGFPWITLKMDPESSTMRKNQHHTTKDAGFDLVIRILESLFEKYNSEIGRMLELEPDVIHDNRPCYQIVFTNDQFRYLDYQVKGGENILSIARKFNISAYLILEKNKSVDGYYDVSAGDKILIPNDYSPRMELLIDKTRHVPLSIKVFDEHGIFEYYRYSSVEINPPLSAEDFSGENDNYGF